MTADALLEAAGLPSATARTFPRCEGVEPPADARTIDARMAVWVALDELTAWNVDHGDTIDRDREGLWQGFALAHKLQRAMAALDAAQWGLK